MGVQSIGKQTPTPQPVNGVQYANVRGNGGRTIRVGWVDGVDVTELFDQLHPLITTQPNRATHPRRRSDLHQQQ